MSHLNVGAAVSIGQQRRSSKAWERRSVYRPAGRFAFSPRHDALREAASATPGPLEIDVGAAA